MSERVIVNLIGHPGCGKSLGCENLSETHGFNVIRPSVLIAKAAQAKGVALNNRADFMRFRGQMKDDNPDVFIEPVVSRPNTNFAYDGLRVPLDNDKLRRVGRLIVIALHAPLVTRFDRALQNHAERNGRDKDTLDEFFADEFGDYYNPDRNEGSVLTVMEEADYWIDTTDLSRDETFRHIEGALIDAGALPIPR